MFLNPAGDCSAHNDTPTDSHCPGGKDHGVEGGHQVNSPIESSPISVAPPSGMCFFICQFGCIPISVVNFICVL